MEIKQYFNIIKKRLWLVLLIIVVITVGTGVYAYMTNSPQYSATAKLVVNSSPTAGEDSTTANIGAINSNIQLIKTYKEIIKTPAIMNKVVKEYPDLNANASQLINQVSVNAVNETQVMSVSVVDTSYESAAKKVNAIAAVFQREIPTLMNFDNIIILDKADPGVSTPPITTSPMLFVLIALVLSVVVGIAIAFLLEYMDDSIKSEEDIRDVLGMPVLGVIAKMKEEDMTAKERVPAKPFTGGGERANHT